MLVGSAMMEYFSKCIAPVEFYSTYQEAMYQGLPVNSLLYDSLETPGCTLEGI